MTDTAPSYPSWNALWAVVASTAGATVLSGIAHLLRAITPAVAETIWFTYAGGVIACVVLVQTRLRRFAWFAPVSGMALSTVMTIVLASTMRGV